MVYAIIAVLILIGDQWLKMWVSNNIEYGTGFKELISNVIQLTNVHNEGAAFNMLPGGRWIFVGLMVVFAVIVIYALANNKIKGAFGRWAIVITLAGALGNGIDRLIRGYVVDMFELLFINFPIFNIADIFICVGGVLFCLYIIFHKEPEATQEELDRIDAAKRREAEARRKSVQVADIEQVSRPVVTVRDAADPVEALQRTGKIPVQKPAQSRQPARSAAQAAATGTQERRSAQKLDDSLVWDTPIVTTPDGKPRSRPAEPAKPARQEARPVRDESDEFSLEDILSEFRD